MTNESSKSQIFANPVLFGGGGKAWLLPRLKLGLPSARTLGRSVARSLSRSNVVQKVTLNKKLIFQYLLPPARPYKNCQPCISKIKTIENRTWDTNIKYVWSNIELPKKYPAKKSRRTSNTREILPKNGPSNTEQPNCFIVSVSISLDAEFYEMSRSVFEGLSSDGLGGKLSMNHY